MKREDGIALISPLLLIGTGSGQIEQNLICVQTLTCKEEKRRKPLIGMSLLIGYCNRLWNNKYGESKSVDHYSLSFSPRPHRPNNDRNTNQLQ